ncbi:MAG TPA: L,D-transpeptidase [Rhodothermales bacterium]|nr:L,D-transpeptidase [Rhodothermales bacterium]
MRTLFFALMLSMCTGLASAQLAPDAPVAEASPGGSAWPDGVEQVDATNPSARRGEPEGELFYVVGRPTTLFRDAGLTQPYARLELREPVYLLHREMGCSEVRTRDGAHGYIPSMYLSNVWIRISKAKRTLYLYRGDELLKTIPADVGYNSFANKEKRAGVRDRDNWRTPEGRFFVVERKPDSEYYKAFLLNYPNVEHAERGLKSHLISRQQYEAIVRAEEKSKTPPMNTALGGYIEIHGHGTGARTNWTQGCVALSDEVMDELWTVVAVGTPVLIEP